MAAARDPRSDPGSALRERARRQPAYFGRLSRWLRPPRTLRPTRAGWAFFAFTFGVGFAALNTGNNLLYLVLALMLAFLVLSGVLSESALRGIRVRRRVPRELFAGQEASVGLEISNHQRRLASFAIVVEDRIADADASDRSAGRCFALRVGPGETELRSYRHRPEARGHLDFVGFCVFTRFPFGLFSKALVISAPQRALVYPAVERLCAPPRLGAQARSGESLAGPLGHGSDVQGLREYAPGDSMRRIHWPASLRSRALLVRQVTSDREAEVEVRLRTAGLPPGDAFEKLVRWSASEVVSLLDAGLRVALRTDSAQFPADCGTRQRARLLSFLALVEPSLEPESP